MKNLRFAIGVTVVAVAVTAGVALFLSGKLSPLGDEPHYLVMADALTHDLTFDLRDAYAREGRTHRIYGDRLNPHILIVNHRWGGYHEPGLALLLAIPYLFGGVLGARLALSVMVGFLAWSVFVWFRERLLEASAAWLTIGLMVSIPIAFGGSQIYPDLPAGIAVTMLTLWLLRRRSEERPAAMDAVRWAAFWLACGLLPWLNGKFLFVTAALAAGGIGRLWRLRGKRDLKVAWATFGLIAAGPATLAAYHFWASGTPLGVRCCAELKTWPLRALMIFLGLHFDQGQGMFFQQPLLVGGVMALVPFARRRPRTALFWIALYGSLIVPNSFELARYGGGGPAGRFGWGAEWLWIIPLAFLIAEHRERSGSYVRAAVIAALVYQVLLALRWLGDPIVLFTELADTLDSRNSLFPVTIRRFLPSFYFWDFKSYLTYGPNLVVYLGCLGLIAAGALPGFRSAPAPSHPIDSVQ
ncbi:MAG TPA: hypothetical protein VGZ27_00595 [Vicinamibacterales bacterium]|nr:hypothetical protein [Vicinamibacterales bacterium]